ncbi:MAG: hypothetical protein HY306_01580 [Nitrosomonadales bacterium]|nr:hypothetical protein [Nitrosomonadales bacterium]
MNPKFITLFAAMLLLAACGDKPQTPTPQTAPAPLFKPQRDALDKARGVEQTEAQSAENLKKEEEKQTQ